MKLLGYQVTAIALIWVGMLSFYVELDNLGKTFFYVVTGWLLFLIISFVKQQKNKRNDNEEN